MVLWKDKQNWWVLNYTHQEKKKKRIQINKNQRWKKSIKIDNRNTKNHKGLLWTMIHQEIEQSRRNV